MSESQPTTELEITSAGEHWVYSLGKDRVLVGNGPEADLVLRDPSVSPRHAQISRINGRLQLLDLGSAGGTFVNGEPVGSREIEPGDVLHFGDVRVTFAGAEPNEQPAPPEEPPAPQPSPSGVARRGVVAVGVMVVAVVVGIGALAFFSPGLGPLFGARARAVGGEEPRALVSAPPERDPKRLMGKCKAFSDPESEAYDVDACLRSCGEAHELDPTLGAGSRASICKLEQEATRILERARALSTEGRAEEALLLLEQCPRGSSVFPRALALYGQLEMTLVKRYRAQCKSAMDAGLFESAYRTCRRVLDVTCNHPEGPDEEALRRLRHAARELGKEEADYECRPSLHLRH